MRDPHEPADAFITRLETHISSELQRHRTAAPFRWIPRTRIKFAIAAACLVIVSMAIGGAAVVAAQQVQSSAQRELLVRSYEQRVALARERLNMAVTDNKAAKQRMQVGVATPEDAAETEFKVRQAEAEVQVAMLQLEEVQASSREPVDTVSAPLVSGRDFVQRRWEVALLAPKAALDLAKLQLNGAQRRFNVGVADAYEMAQARAKVLELEATIELMQRKLELRQRFLKKDLDAAQADLRVLEAEATQRRLTLLAQLELAKTDQDRIEKRIAAGSPWMAKSDDQARMKARVRIIELDLELTKTDYELQLIKLRLAGK